MPILFTGKSLLNALILSLFIFSLCLLYHFITAPQSYEDCILNYIKSNESNYAINLIDDICKSKHPS
jgi:hypothetical protein